MAQDQQIPITSDDASRIASDSRSQDHIIIWITANRLCRRCWRNNLCLLLKHLQSLFHIRITVAKYVE